MAEMQLVQEFLDKMLAYQVLGAADYQGFIDGFERLNETYAKVFSLSIIFVVGRFLSVFFSSRSLSVRERLSFATEEVFVKSFGINIAFIVVIALLYGLAEGKMSVFYQVAFCIFLGCLGYGLEFFIRAMDGTENKSALGFLCGAFIGIVICFFVYQSALGFKAFAQEMVQEGQAVETSLVPSQDIRDWQHKINTEMRLETKNLLDKMLEEKLTREKYFELFLCLGITDSLEDVKATLNKRNGNIEKHLPQYQNPYKIARCFSRTK